ncbi:RagB/SusD family nutrient uptake outer membrane protein [Niabella sp. CC-SYL272]|uniref:RagB/SusD family nutrient uptake outer membrane protein n=1 Tax=Niabella agricola TaxID=2891571 RepID=UPI001F4428D1|nr:RagB/SusD family nutrient uptake outer membrane protein [Niabella agricola]MCF3107491.1 RagB/SusD family nutrient uptake outer membrane protein [Niabella agricola]
MNSILKVIFRSVYFIAAIGMTGCNKLKELPESVITEDQYYKTATDAVSAVNAAYGSLNGDPAGDFPIYGRNLNILISNGSDEQIFSPSNTNPDVRAIGTITYVAENDRVRKIWQQHYYGINRANVAVDKIPGIEMDETTRSRLINEARFIRGLLYFNLVRLFGGVPLVLHNPSSTDIEDVMVKRATPEEVYAQVIADFTAATALPASYSGADKGRATSGAAWGLLAKVYVTKKNWELARTTLEKVLTAGTFTAARGTYGYDLFPVFKDAFQKPTKNGKEHLFSVQYESNLGARNVQNFLSGSNFNSFNPKSFPGDVPDENLPKIFDDADTRKAASFFTKMLNPVTGQEVDFSPVTRYAKFIDFSLNPITNQAQSGINYPVLRYADVLLLYAEVLNELQGPVAEAYKALNIVRARAYGFYTGNGSYTDHSRDLSELDQAGFREAVFLERRKELVQEGNRWFDLVRKGSLVEELKKIPAKANNVSEKHYLFPIPQVEIDLNNLLIQNPGWSR